MNKKKERLVATVGGIGNGSHVNEGVLYTIDKNDGSWRANYMQWMNVEKE
jgi:hypothetical protein